MASYTDEKESSLMLSKTNQLLLQTVSADVTMFEMRATNLVIASDDGERAAGEKTGSDQKVTRDIQVVTQGVESVRCECCGMSEECTPTYIRRIRDAFHGNWVCGLCSEAINLELQMKREAHPTSSSSPPPLMITKAEALASHMSLCSKFNRTVRMNPKLSLAISMRDIAKKCSQRRTTTTADMAMPKNNIARAISCGPRMEL
ncbi:hypothetical protein ZIOFF_025301 [Zingiber officinale]|uniref:DUF1677 family protein n=1 Tax=Zingiber officinale TaxID=94328 RepID=A0A8J5H1K6_ZINOF|nr:hypothetical protein ZIOFF_025301 [Zingiber officinale]